MKRLFDTIIGILCLTISLPLMIIVSIAIKVDSKGPIFFKSLRVGQYGKEFNMFKFRTMFEGTRIEETKKIKNVNKKITKIGTFLRKSSLDELPQLFNVLSGKMSIVGPRPALKTQKFIIKKRAHFKINNIKPGITGLAQIN
jgi:O-antigen biosynthesis protein WbqP